MTENIRPKLQKALHEADISEELEKYRNEIFKLIKDRENADYIKQNLIFQLTNTDKYFNSIPEKPIEFNTIVEFFERYSINIEKEKPINIHKIFEFFLFYEYYDQKYQQKRFNTIYPKYDYYEYKLKIHGNALKGTPENNYVRQTLLTALETFYHITDRSIEEMANVARKISLEYVIQKGYQINFENVYQFMSTIENRERIESIASSLPYTPTDMIYNIVFAPFVTKEKEV